MKGLTLINLLLAIVCMVTGAITQNWAAMIGWFMAIFWILRHILEKELK